MAEKADVIVVGGGVIGICTAYYLARKGRTVILLEKD
jgi:glycine/D-amino acid oxidase-like deaminating enzyme